MRKACPGIIRRWLVTIVELVKVCADDPSLPFLVIGGHAVIAHGYPRLTHDLDFLVRKSQRDLWRIKVLRLGFHVFEERASFIQFSRSAGMPDWDLMLVNDLTFEKMWAESITIDFAGTGARMVALDHLIALKLHVLKQNLPHRALRDLDDVINLVLKNGLDIRTERYRTLFLKYGDQLTYDRVLRATGAP